MQFQGLLMFLKANSNGIAQKNVAADLGEWSFIITFEQNFKVRATFWITQFLFLRKKNQNPHSHRIVV